MKLFLPIVTVIALASAGPAMAGDDCHQPMAEWQSREAVTAHATALGITPERLRIDDGCYEIRGRDGDGNRVGLKIDPATLAVLKLEVRFHPGADASRYLPGTRGPAGRANKHPAGKPLPTPTPP